jgi:hydroxymethylpyrimidine pyrophosphatase-like HAD family hydrolase
MLKTAGKSFAMGHAMDRVREAADDVLDADRTTGGAVAEIAKRVWGVEI